MFFFLACEGRGTEEDGEGARTGEIGFSVQSLNVGNNLKFGEVLQVRFRALPHLLVFPLSPSKKNSPQFDISEQLDPVLVTGRDVVGVIGSALLFRTKLPGF